MPNVTLHLILADRVLDRWERAPSEAPFDPREPAARNAFYQGSFGPDIGYFPGGDPFLSDLAHYVRAGELTRALVRRASTAREEAYAWGWLTHVLGDRAVHPLVGEAVGEVQTGERGGFVGIGQDRAGHVQVEVGLDAFFSERYPDLRDRRSTAVFDRPGVRFLADAYRSTYGLEIDPSHLLGSHHAAVRMSNHALSTIGVLGSAVTSGVLGASGPAGPTADAATERSWGLQQVVEAVQEGLGQESMILAFLNLLPPSPWLVEEVDDVVESFADWFEPYVGPGLEELPDFNLDTGRTQENGPGTPCAERTHRILRRVRGLSSAGARRNGAEPVRYSGVVDPAF